MAECIMHDGNWQDFVNPVIDGEQKSHGLIPRDFTQHPVGYLACAKPFDLPLIPQSEWQARLDAQIAAKAQLSDIRNGGMGGQPIPSRDQDGVGYCWCHSGTSGMLIARAIMNEPYADLSAFSVGCLIKGYRDEGGFGAEGVEWMAAHGVATSEYWPQRSMSRSNDNPAMRANAILHKDLKWMDLDPNQMKAQLVTCLLLGIPVVADYNRWSHSVLAVDVVSLNPFSHRIWNSWSDSYGQNGMGILQGDSWLPDAGVAIQVITGSQG